MWSSLRQKDKIQNKRAADAVDATAKKQTEFIALPYVRCVAYVACVGWQPRLTCCMAVRPKLIQRVVDTVVDRMLVYRVRLNDYICTKHQFMQSLTAYMQCLKVNIEISGKDDIELINMYFCGISHQSPPSHQIAINLPLKNRSEIGLGLF